MNNHPDNQAVDRACRWYRRLLVFYPRAHREEYGVAILQLFRDQCRDAWASGGSLSLLALCPVAVLDLLKTSLWEHLATLNRSRLMLRSFRPTIKPLPEFFLLVVAVFLPVFLCGILITYMIPKTYGSVTMIRLRDAPGSSTGSLFDPYRLKNAFETIQSHEVLEKVVKELGLKESWGKKYNAGQPLSGLDIEAMIRYRIEVQLIHNTQMLQITAYSDNPGEAAKLANGIIAGYRACLAEKAAMTSTVSSGMVVDETVDIIMPAVPQFRPVRPNKRFNAVVGALAGLMAGLVVAPFVLGFVGEVRKSKVPPVMPQNS